MTTPAELARRAFRVLALLVLALAVVAMHSLGAGHAHLAPAQHGAAPSGHAAGLTTAAKSHHGDDPAALAAAPTMSAPTMSAPTMAMVAAAPDARVDCGDDCRPAADSKGASSAGSMAGHLMGAMCLAVLSALLVLLLLVALRAQGGRYRITASHHWWHTVTTPRGPPRQLAMSLAQVCVLRT